MNKGIKRILHEHFDEMSECAKRTRKVEYSYAMEELIDLYYEICGISYDAAAAELHGRDTNDED